MSRYFFPRYRAHHGSGYHCNVWSEGTDLSSGGLITQNTVKSVGQKLGVLSSDGDALRLLYHTDYKRLVPEAEQYRRLHAPNN